MSRLPPASETDYLGSLVSRALGGPRSIGPRLPSIFEPPPATTLRSIDGVDREERSGEPAESTTPARERWHPQEQAGALGAELERPYLGASPSDRAREALEPEAETLDSPSSSRREQPAAMARHRRQPVSGVSVGEDDPGISRPRDGRRSERPPQIAPKIGWTGERSERSPAHSSIVSELRVVVESGRDDSRTPVAVTEGPTHPRDVLAGDPVGIMVPRAAPIGPGLPPGPRRSEPTTATAASDLDPPRVVNVTIGRVEVRAVADHTKPPLQPAERRQASLTLEQYLRQRDGGR